MGHSRQQAASNDTTQMEDVAVEGESLVEGGEDGTEEKEEDPDENDMANLLDAELAEAWDHADKESEEDARKLKTNPNGRKRAKLVKNKDGTYRKPKGRAPAGHAWDKHQGEWVAA